MSVSKSQAEIVEVYEASVKVYIDSITTSIRDFLEQYVEHDADIKFLMEWGVVLPNVDISHSGMSAKELSDSISKALNLDLITKIEQDLLTAITHKQSAVLVRDTVIKVNDYVHKYDIDTRGVDNYKVRFFMGLTLIEHLDAHKERFLMPPRLLRGVSHLMLLNAMYGTLRIEDNTKIPKEMFKKFKICLLEDKGRGLDRIFGEYGLYLLFKTLSKTLAQERTAMAHALLPNA